MKKTLLALTMGLCLQTAMAQQDAQFSQYLFNGIYINPAYAGYREELNLHAFYRTQWTGIEGAPRTASAAVDAIANDGNVGLAFQIASDRLGDQQFGSAYASYAYRLRLNAEGTSRLAFGLSAGVAQFGYDWGGSITNDQENFSGMERTTVPDGRAGVYFSTEHFFAGVSADNLISSQFSAEKFRGVPRPVAHGYVTAGGLVPLSGGIALKPSFLLREDFRGPSNLDLNAMLLLGQKLWLGGSYRTAVKLWDKEHLDPGLNRRNSAVAVAEVFPVDGLRIGYAYDFSVGPLRGQSGGTHEISVGYAFGRRQMRMSTPRVF